MCPYVPPPAEYIKQSFIVGGQVMWFKSSFNLLPQKKQKDFTKGNPAYVFSYVTFCALCGSNIFGP
jgi:hypothetical protein